MGTKPLETPTSRFLDARAKWNTFCPAALPKLQNSTWAKAIDVHVYNYTDLRDVKAFKQTCAYHMINTNN